MELAGCYGASAVGVATIDTLAGGPPSTDLTYVLPSARSAISFAVPLNQDYIDLWFSKKSHTKHFKDNIQANVIASGISLELANYLGQKGYPSIPLTANTAYREESKNGRYDEKPPISHRYLAVRSGVGFFWLIRQCAHENRRSCYYPWLGGHRSRIDTDRTPAGRRELL